MENNKLLTQFKDCLSGIECDKDAFSQCSFDEEVRINLPEGLAPQPYMVFIALVFLAEFEYWGKRYEKELWAIPIKYKSISFLLAHRKFGFRLYSHKNYSFSSGLAEEMITKINNAIKRADQLIQPFVKEQIGYGNILIANNYIKLDMMYRFFRAKAKSAFRRKPPKPKVLARDKNGNPTTTTHDPFKPHREGFYYSIASIDAFFSRLEHILVLAIPFIDFDSSRDDLQKLMCDNWTDKYKRIFNLEANKFAMQYYNELKKIKDKYRNSISHGFFERDGASLFFHCGPIGAVPVYLSKFDESIHYSFLPITETSFVDICKLFDKVDRFLKLDVTKYAIRYAEAGLDVSFSKGSIKEYRNASKSDESFESFLEYMGHISDMSTNMDW
jgi:hypothetical protein